MQIQVLRDEIERSIRRSQVVFMNANWFVNFILRVATSDMPFAAWSNFEELWAGMSNHVEPQTQNGNYDGVMKYSKQMVPVSALAVVVRQAVLAASICKNRIVIVKDGAVAVDAEHVTNNDGLGLQAKK